MINRILTIIPITTGDATSDVVTIAAIIGIAVILLVNLILDNRGDGVGRGRPCS